jgi:hypothetical protein
LIEVFVNFGVKFDADVFVYVYSDFVVALEDFDTGLVG